MSLLEGDLGADNDTSTGENLGLSSSNGDIKGLGGCGKNRLVCRLCHSKHDGIV